MGELRALSSDPASEDRTADATAPAPAWHSRAGLLTAGYYAAVFAVLGAYLPFWPVWLAEQGLGVAEIGSIVSAALLLRLVTVPALTALADRFALRRAMLAGAGFVSAALFLVHLGAEGQGALLALGLALTFSFSLMVPLGEALGLRASGRFGFAYAQARAAGSIAFLLANIAMGWAMAAFGADALIWVLAAGCVLAGAIGALHPGGGAPRGSGVAGAGMDRAGFREGFALLGDRRLLLFALAAGLGQSSHAVYFLFASLDWADQGISAETVGMLWAAGVVAETVLMLGPGGRWLRRLGAPGAIALGAAAAALRWVAMAFEPALWALWPLQALHALTFALSHLGIMAFAAAAIPDRLQASGQGVLLGLTQGVMLALATFAAGLVEGALGREGAWLMAAGMAAAGAALALWLRPDRG
ncbi:MAG: MFS transporter [Pseudomonadota bacterium]